MSDSSKSAPSADSGGLSANSLSSVRRRMDDFDQLPPEVREALSSSDEPSDQMIDVLCAMNRGGFPLADMMKLIAVNNSRESD